jgi:uncharacterized protein YjgD (DUF1641 family)
METNGSPSLKQTQAARQLQERLNDEQTLHSLDHIVERIGTLEKAVDRLANLLEQGPGMVGMAADMADEAYRQSAAKGIDIEQRLGAALHLAEKITAPETVEKIESMFEALDKLPNMISMAADMADETYRQTAAKGIDIEQRLGAALELAEKITAPETVEKINTLLAVADQVPVMISMTADAVDEEIRHACDRGVNIDKRVGTALRMAEKITDPKMEERFNQLLDLSDQMPGLTAMVIDILDEGYRKAVSQGLDLETLAQQGTYALKQMVALLGSEEFKALMSSGVLSPSTLNVVSQAGEALIESQQAEHKKVGLFGTMRALGDPDRKRAMGFVMTFMKNFGKKL